MKEAYRDVNDTPDTTLAVLLEDLADVFMLREVCLEDINLGAVLVLGGGIRREIVACKLRDPVKGFGTGVVIVVNRDDLVATSLLQGIDDVRA